MLRCQQLLVFNIYERNTFYIQLSWAWKSFITSVPAGGTRTMSMENITRETIQNELLRVSLTLYEMATQVQDYVYHMRF